METRSADCVVIGAGVAGAATAFHLARRGLGRVLVLDREGAPGHHSSGRSAAMVRQLVDDPEIGALAREGARFIAALATPTAGPPLLRTTGSVLLAEASGAETLARSALLAGRGGAAVEEWTRQRVVTAIPPVRGSRFEIAVHATRDGVVDAPRLLRTMLRGVEEEGGAVLTGQKVREIRTDGRGTVRGVSTDSLDIATGRVVNAAGAWATRLATLAGAAAPELEPRRRHLARSRPRPGAPPPWPWVWHVGQGAYFRPDGSALLVCGCDSAADSPGSAVASPEAAEELRRKVEHVFPGLAGLEVATLWAGHRTFARDGRFVIGPDPEVAGLWWVAGLGGHGITTCGAVGRLAADLVVLPERDATNPFSPSRSSLRAPTRG